jgi:hypothetical protein
MGLLENYKSFKKNAGVFELDRTVQMSAKRLEKGLEKNIFD